MERIVLLCLVSTCLLAVHAQVTRLQPGKQYYSRIVDNFLFFYFRDLCSAQNGSQSDLKVNRIGFNLLPRVQQKLTLKNLFCFVLFFQEREVRNDLTPMDEIIKANENHGMFIPVI